ELVVVVPQLVLRFEAERVCDHLGASVERGDRDANTLGPVELGAEAAGFAQERAAEADPRQVWPQPGADVEDALLLVQSGHARVLAEAAETDQHAVFVQACE